MKKYLLLLLFAPLLAFAEEQTHFSRNVSASGATVATVAQFFPSWFSLDSLANFVLDCDKTDIAGFRHLNYQQYEDDVPVEGCRIIAHVRDSAVAFINGVVLENYQSDATPSRLMGKRQVADAVPFCSESEVELMLTPVYVGGRVVYKRAYKVSSFSEGVDIYFDAVTGEELKRISTTPSVSGTANTYYAGIQNIACSLDSGAYVLADLDRKIFTYNASKITSSLLINVAPNDVVSAIADSLDQMYPPEQLNDIRFCEATLRNAVMQNYLLPNARQTISLPSSDTAFFSGTMVTEVVITAINTDRWQELSESAPDLFITIEDQNSIERYNNRANRISGDSLPVSFSLSVPMWADEYVLRIWSYDANGDNLIASLQLDQQVGTFSYSGRVNAMVTQSSGAPSPVLDAHWGIEQTYDFYRNVFGRNSFDDMGSPIYQFVNVPDAVITDGNNAYASFIRGRSAYMVYGMGDGVTINPLVDLTTASHEFSHLITDFSSSWGLKYQNESGAMNEGFSDIFATCIENYVLGASSWLIGGDGMMIGKSNLRSMADPYQNEDGDTPGPKAYMGNHWLATTDAPSDKNDYGGVHRNSSVLNYWFYVLCTGGTFTNEFDNTFTVEGIGIDKAQVLAYMLNQYYLTEYATYHDAYSASSIIAELLYGSGSDEHQAVQNAWGVVGIGNGYEGNTSAWLDATLDAPGATKCILNGQLLILRNGHKFTATGAIVE